MKYIILLITAIFIAPIALFAERGDRQLVIDFDYRGIDEVVVSNAGVVHIEAVGSNTQKVTGRFYSEYPRDFKIRHEKKGKTLFIRITKRRRRFHWNFKSTVLELSVPRNINLDLQNSVGSIVAEDIEGDLRLRCSTGLIEASYCEGTFRTNTTTGGQNFFDCKGEILASCTTGRIYVSDFQGELDLETTTGNQRGEYIELTGNARLSTTTGMIRMDLTNSDDELTFDLETTVGSIKLNDVKSKGRLITGEGDIEVRSRTTTGTQSFSTGR